MSQARSALHACWVQAQHLQARQGQTRMSTWPRAGRGAPRLFSQSAILYCSFITHTPAICARRARAGSEAQENASPCSMSLALECRERAWAYNAGPYVMCPAHAGSGCEVRSEQRLFLTAHCMWFKLLGSARHTLKNIETPGSPTLSAATARTHDVSLLNTPNLASQHELEITQSGSFTHCIQDRYKQTQVAVNTNFT